VTVTQQPQPLADRIAAALSEAGAFCGECGFEPGETGCPDCVRVREQYTQALLAVVQSELDQRDTEIRRLRAELEQAREQAADRAPATLVPPASFITKAMANVPDALPPDFS
jgi:hypothetical protein